MTPKRLRSPLIRVLATGAMASLAVLAACEAKLPTSEDVNGMTAASATTAAGRMAMIDTSKAVYFVNAREVTKAEAEKIAAEQIATVNVTQKGMQNGGEVRIITKMLAEGIAAASGVKDTGQMRITYKRLDADAATDPTGVTAKQAAETKPRTPFTGIVIIDGIVSDMMALSRISPDQIASVDVIKGATATSQYSDPRAANGVIVVHTKGAKQ